MSEDQNDFRCALMPGDAMRVEPCGHPEACVHIEIAAEYSPDIALSREDTLRLIAVLQAIVGGTP